MDVGVMDEEQVSYDHVTTLFYLAVCLFPLLSILEICAYCAYQYKVKTYVSCQHLARTQFNVFQFHPWVDIIKENVERVEDVETKL